MCLIHCGGLIQILHDSQYSRNVTGTFHCMSDEKATFPLWPSKMNSVKDELQINQPWQTSWFLGEKQSIAFHIMLAHLPLNDGNDEFTVIWQSINAQQRFNAATFSFQLWKLGLKIQQGWNSEVLREPPFVKWQNLMLGWICYCARYSHGYYWPQKGSHALPFQWQHIWPYPSSPWSKIWCLICPKYISPLSTLIRCPQLIHSSCIGYTS